MTAKIKIPNLDNLISRYQAGESPQKLLSEWHISRTTFNRLLVNAGVPRHGNRLDVPVSEIVSRYISGESVLALSKAFKLERTVIDRRLRQAGVHIRNGSEANIIRMSRMTPAEIIKLTEACHNAVRGSHKSLKAKRNYAITRESRPWLSASLSEYRMSQMLFNMGVATIPQKAIGVYNVDLAIEKPRIAVEIYGGHWHISQKHIRLHKERTPYILNAGWSLIIVWIDNRANPLRQSAADYIVAFMQSRSLDKTSVSEYRMIRGNGQPVSGCGTDFDYSPLVPCPTDSI